MLGAAWVHKTGFMLLQHRSAAREARTRLHQGESYGRRLSSAGNLVLWTTDCRCTISSCSGFNFSYHIWVLAFLTNGFPGVLVGNEILGQLMKSIWISKVSALSTKLLLFYIEDPRAKRVYHTPSLLVVLEESNIEWLQRKLKTCLIALCRWIFH